MYCVTWTMPSILRLNYNITQYIVIHCNTFLIQLSCNTGDCVTPKNTKKRRKKNWTSWGESNRVRPL